MSEFAMHAHLGAIQRYDDLCMTIMRKVADGGSLADVLQIVGDAMNACDHVDDENVALWNEAHTAALDVAARWADLRERVEALTAALRELVALNHVKLLKRNRYICRWCEHRAVEVGARIPHDPECIFETLVPDARRVLGESKVGIVATDSKSELPRPAMDDADVRALQTASEVDVVEWAFDDRRTWNDGKQSWVAGTKHDLAVEAVEALARKRAADALEAAAEESGDTE